MKLTAVNIRSEWVYDQLMPSTATDPLLGTRERLLAAAVDLMAEHGAIELVSLRSVAAAAQVSPTAVYRHFDDHDALLVAALEWAWEEFAGALRRAGGDDPDPHDRLRRQGHAYVDLALDRAGVYTVLFGHRNAASGTRTEAGYRVFDGLVELVGAVLRANDDDRPPFDVAVHLFTAIHGIVHLRSVQPGFPWPPLDRQLSELLDHLDLAPGIHPDRGSRSAV